VADREGKLRNAEDELGAQHRVVAVERTQFESQRTALEQRCLNLDKCVSPLGERGVDWAGAGYPSGGVPQLPRGSATYLLTCPAVVHQCSPKPRTPCATPNPDLAAEHPH
jgi:hypothetical protein